MLFPPEQPPLPPRMPQQPQKTKEEMEKEEYQKMIDEMYKGNDNSDQYDLHK